MVAEGLEGVEPPAFILQAGLKFIADSANAADQQSLHSLSTRTDLSRAAMIYAKLSGLAAASGNMSPER